MSEPPRKVEAARVLGAPRAPVTRYRPWIVAAGAGVVVLLVGFGFMVGLRDNRTASVDPVPPPASAPTGPAELEGRLPASYDDPLALGPDAPGASDVRVAGAAEPPADPATTQVAPSPAETAQLQEARAARASAPFFGGAGAMGERPSPAGVAAPASAGSAAAPGTAKDRFIASAASDQDVVPRLPSAPLSAFEVKAGAIIAAALVTGLNSDLPGPVIAQVTEPVFDHLTGRKVLIPQGARLIGRYDSQVSYGQDRALVVWTRIVFPDGRSLNIGAMAGADTTGAGGLADRVDTHLPAMARAAGLSTLITMGAAAAQNSIARSSDNLVLQDGAGGIASSASQIGQRIVERDLQRAPTLRVRPGWPLRLIVDKDLLLTP